MDFPTCVPSALTSALETKGYAALTDVQSAVLADDAAGADLLVSARTGSGKTVAFGLAMGADLLAGEDALPFAGAPLALVIAPTRELALQVERELSWLYADAKGRLASCVGGMDARSERRTLQRGAHIVVGTPGRLRDHIERGALDLSSVRAVVLDEADEMLDFGFKEDLEFILEAAPATRRTLLFSATVSKPIAELARSYQRDAVRISTAGDTGQHADITYLAHTVAGHEREAAVINVLRFHDAQRALVFCTTREAVNQLVVKLQNAGFAAVALSGELTQAERTKALDALRDGRAKVCVATDVAARGIDLPGLELVVHAEPPTNAESLQHRSGRTGRAGAKGVSVFVVASSRKGRVIRLLREANIEAEWTEAPGADAIRARDTERLASLPAFSAELNEARLDEARALIERFGAERVAAAFLAEREARLPSVHTLSPAPTAPGKAARSERAARRDRADFDDNAWLEVNLGRKQRAEPRWLVPLICRVGDVTGADIGAIRIEETVTRFQIAEDKRPAFMAALKRPRDRDENVRITLAGQAGETADAAPAPVKRAAPGKAKRPTESRAERPAKRAAERPAESRPDQPAQRSFERAPERKADRKPQRSFARADLRDEDGAGRTKRRARPGKAERQAIKAGKASRETRPVRDWAPKAKPAGGPGPKLKRVKKRST